MMGNEQVTVPISVVDSISVDIPAKNALDILRNLKNIELYEPKADSIRVEPETEKRGTYSIQGHFAGMRWRGRFTCEFDRQGFHSEMIRGPLGVKLRAGFVVTSESSGRCIIPHYECYHFPRWVLPLTLLVRLYLYWAMKKELRNLVKIIYGRFQPAGRKLAAPIAVREG